MFRPIKYVLIVATCAYLPCANSTALGQSEKYASEKVEQPSVTKPINQRETRAQRPTRNLLQTTTNTTESSSDTNSDTTTIDNAILAIETISSVVGAVTGVTLLYGLYKYLRHRQKHIQEHFSRQRRAEEGRRGQEKALIELFDKYQKPALHFTPHSSMGAANVMPLQSITPENNARYNALQTEQLIETLLGAISNESAEGVQQASAILTCHPELANIPDESGTHPLHIAIHANNENTAEIVSLLLEAGADPEAQTHDGLTPLFLAVTIGNSAVVRLLLDKIRTNPTQIQACISATYENGSTLLHIAAYSGFAEIAELLLENGANLEALTHEGLTPIYLAVANGDAITLRALLDWKHQITEEEASLYLHLATQQGNSGTLTALLQRKLNLLLQLEQPKEPKLVRRLLPAKTAKKKPAQSVEGQTLLHEAAAEGHTEVLAELLSTQVITVNAVDDFGNTALHIAAANGNLGIVEQLLNAGADPDAPNQDGYTPLHRAVQKKKHSVVVQLLSKGANRNIQAKDGSTPLHLAAERGSTETARLLIQGTRRNLRRNGNTPLHLAVEHGHEDVVELLTSSSDVDASNGEGYSPLHIAVMHQNINILSHLLSHGANQNRRSSPIQKGASKETPKPKETPKEMAQRLGFQNVVNRLERAERKTVERGMAAATGEPGRAALESGD